MTLLEIALVSAAASCVGFVGGVVATLIHRAQMEGTWKA